MELCQKVFDITVDYFLLCDLTRVCYFSLWIVNGALFFVLHRAGEYDPQHHQRIDWRVLGYTVYHFSQLVIGPSASRHATASQKTTTGSYQEDCMLQYISHIELTGILLRPSVHSPSLKNALCCSACWAQARYRSWLARIAMDPFE